MIENKGLNNLSDSCCGSLLGNDRNPIQVIYNADINTDRCRYKKGMFVQTYVQPACTWPCLYSGRHRFAPLCWSRERSFVSWKQWTPDKAQDTLPGPSRHRTAPL